MTAYRVYDHRLLDVPYRRSPNQSATPPRPLFLVMHYTAGSGMSSVDWMCNPAAGASAHLWIGRDGHVVQMVRFDRRAWHAGESRWTHAGTHYHALNASSIGIELDNLGWLTRSADGGKWSGKRRVPDAEVFEGRHWNARHTARWWHAYPPEQIAVAVAVARALHARYGFLDVLGHDDIAPDRKADPGPAFPMATFRRDVLTGGPDR